MVDLNRFKKKSQCDLFVCFIIAAMQIQISVLMSLLVLFNSTRETGLLMPVTFFTAVK